MILSQMVRKPTYHSEVTRQADCAIWLVRFFAVLAHGSPYWIGLMPCYLNKNNNCNDHNHSNNINNNRIQSTIKITRASNGSNEINTNTNTSTTTSTNNNKNIKKKLGNTRTRKGQQHLQCYKKGFLFGHLIGRCLLVLLSHQSRCCNHHWTCSTVLQLSFSFIWW